VPEPRPAGAGLGDPRAQASVELVAALPALILAGLVALQLLVAGYALTLADGAAEAGAAALAAGRPAEPAVRAALPGWARDRVGLKVAGGRVRVRLDVPALVPMPGALLETGSSAAIPVRGS
jgi:hypothetical protein